MPQSTGAVILRQVQSQLSIWITAFSCEFLLQPGDDGESVFTGSMVTVEDADVDPAHVVYSVEVWPHIKL